MQLFGDIVQAWTVSLVIQKHCDCLAGIKVLLSFFNQVPKWHFWHPPQLTFPAFAVQCFHPNKPTLIRLNCTYTTAAATSSRATISLHTMFTVTAHSHSHISISLSVSPEGSISQLRDTSLCVTFGLHIIAQSTRALAKWQLSEERSYSKRNSLFLKEKRKNLHSHWTAIFLIEGFIKTLVNVIL